MAEKNSTPKLNWKDIAKEYLWPVDPAARAKKKIKYRNIGLFIIVSTILYRYGKQVAGLVYDQDQQEDMVRMSMQ